MAKNRTSRRVFTGLLVAVVSVGTALLTTAEGGDPECFKKSYGYYSPVHGIDGTLHISASKGAIEAIERLLNAGANADVSNSFGYSPLHVAAFAGHTAIAEALLNAGGDPNVIPKEAPSSGGVLDKCGGVTPLHFAASNGHVDIVSALLLAGADANATDQRGTTPIYWADKGGHVDAVVALLEAGANH